MLHMHGKAAKRSPVPSLLQTVLLRLHPPLADRAAVPMPPLPGPTAHKRARQLQMGRGDHAATRHAPAGHDQLQTLQNTKQRF